MLKSQTFALVILFAAMTAGPVVAQDLPGRPTVAIANVEIVPGAWTVPPPQLGDAIAHLLIDELVTSSVFRVMDGQWLVPEDQMGRMTSVPQLRAAAASRNLDYVVIGTVTAFSTERKGRHGGACCRRHSSSEGSPASRR